MNRITHDEAMMSMAYICAMRSTCIRRCVGAVICDNKGHVLGTGFNGVPAATIHCIDQPCPGAEQESGQGLDMCHAIHAEQNAIAHCSDINRARIIYTTTMPCMSCMKALIATRIMEIYYDANYPNQGAADLWLSTGRRLHEFNPTTPLSAALRLDTLYRTAQFKELKAHRARHGDKGPKPH